MRERLSLATCERLHRYRLKISGAALLLFCLLVLLTEGVTARTDAWLDAAGAALIGLGALVRLWALGYISGRKKREVVADGPYRYTRNPLYLGTLVVALGAALLGGSLAGAAALLLAFGLLYPATIRIEERNLLEWFGEDYRRYAAEVPRYFPRFPGACPRSGARFRLVHPVRELLFLTVLVGGVLLVTELMERLQATHGLPGWLR